MQEQNRNPQQGNSPAGQNDKLNTNNPGTSGASKGNDDYRREGVHLGASSSGSSPTEGNRSSSGTSSRETSATKQSGGGASGYDVNREMQPIKEQQEQMHSERNQEDLQIERTQTPRPEPDPGRENPTPDPTPNTPQRETPGPETNPGTTGTRASGNTGGWSQSSWDPNSIH